MRDSQPAAGLDPEISSVYRKACCPMLPKVAPQAVPLPPPPASRLNPVIPKQKRDKWKNDVFLFYHGTQTLEKNKYVLKS